MKKIDDTILGKIFWDRCTEAGNQEIYKKLKNEYREKAKSHIDNKKILSYLKSNIKDEQKTKKIEEMLAEYSTHLIYEMSFESAFFYKLGFKDGYQLHNELDELENEKKPNY